MRNNRLLFSILLVVFIDLLGFSLILPLLPYYARVFQGTDTQIGLLVAIYAAAQLVGSPILGRLSDRYGRRPVLLISIGGNLIGYILLGLAQSMLMLFAARLLAGITAANISVAQAYISDVTDASNRSKGLGMIGAAFGLGFIIGPALGGTLSSFGYAVPAFLSAALGAVNLLLVFLWLPESLTADRRAEVAHQSALSTLSPLGLLHALRRPLVGPLLHTRLWYAIAFSFLPTLFSLYALSRFGLDAQQTGLILTLVGVISVITQAFLISRLTARYSEQGLMVVSSILLALGLLGWGLAPNVLVLLIIIVPTAFASSVMNTIVSSVISKSVPAEEVGGILGIASSLEAASRVISPIFGGLLLDQIGRRFGVFAGTAAPGIFSSLIMAWVATFIYRNIFHTHLPASLEPSPESGKIAD